ncbi:MAG: HAMP domain-containing protein, partial [Planctomycetes bacterium]|nr:HAMP domain-containing protein [Planctomycetota bacterium]
MTLPFGRYFWKLFLVNAALMALVLAGCVWVILRQFDRFHEEELSRHLFAQAAALKVAVNDRFDRAHGGELNALAGKVGSTEIEGIRVTFILADGTVVGDSQAAATKMESHADRPEIRAALENGSGESIRWSRTVAENMKYVAVRMGSASDPRGVVRVSRAVRSIAAQARPAQRLIVTIALISVLAAILLALTLALLWSRRIRRITETALSISRGDLSARVEVFGHDEVALLGRSLNEMRERLSTQLETIDRQRRMLDSLVSQLREGVVVTDGEGRIVLINSEAMALLQLSPSEPEGSFLGQPVEQ